MPKENQRKATLRAKQNQADKPDNGIGQNKKQIVPYHSDSSLSDARLSGGQRQTAALRLGQIGGNRYLQRVIEQTGQNNTNTELNQLTGDQAKVLPQASPSKPLVIQRRLPDFAAVQPIILGGTPAARAAEKKLKQVILKTFERLSAPKKAAAQARFTVLQPAQNWDNLLDTANQLPDPDKAFLGDIIASIEFAQQAAGDPLLKVRYPRPNVQIGPPAPGSVQEANLQQLVTNAIATMTDIGNGLHDAAVNRVFGNGAAAQAKAVFLASAQALTRLQGTAGAIVVDSRGDQEAVHAAGLTGANQMALAPEVVANINPNNQVTIVHESTHAIPAPTTDDAYTDYTAGSSFLTAQPGFKLSRAPYYEEVARQILVPGHPPRQFVPGMAAPPPPGHATNPQVREAQAQVEQMVSRAWTVAINARDSLVAWAQVQQNPAVYGTLTPAALIEFGTHLTNLSRVMGLTLHHRIPVGGQAVAINDLDLSMAENRAAQLSELIHKAKLTNVADDRHLKNPSWTDWLPDVLRGTKAYLSDKILEVLVMTYGYTLKDAEKEIAMIKTLADSYDKGRVDAFRTGIPGPVAGYYQ